MKITKVESLHADAGFRNFDFLKISTDQGITGWSEYNESFGGAGLSAVIDRLAPGLLGKDPRPGGAPVPPLPPGRRLARGVAIRPDCRAQDHGPPVRDGHMPPSSSI